MSVNSFVKEDVLRVELNRPEAHNALNKDMIEGLTKIFKGAAKQKSLRAIFLKGNGPSFCAGGDLQWMRSALKFTHSQNIKDTGQLATMYATIFECPIPLVAYVHGNVMGGGVGLAAVCDIVAAEEGSRFCLSEVKLGLVPSIISPYILRKIPESKARLFMLTAEVFSSSEALNMGLVHFAGKAEDGQSFIDEKLKLISSNGPEALRKTKELIQLIKTKSWTEGRRKTIQVIAERRKSSEGQEGIKAFFEKRSPGWRKN